MVADVDDGVDVVGGLAVGVDGQGEVAEGVEELVVGIGEGRVGLACGVGEEAEASLGDDAAVEEFE